MIKLYLQVSVTAGTSATGDLMYQGVLLTHTLVRFEDDWLSSNPQLVRHHGNNA